MFLKTNAYLHGPSDCRACYDGDSGWHALQERDYHNLDRSWKLRPNPGYWGAADPEVLVLGFSKGGDQNEMIDLHLRGRKKFEDIPFDSAQSSIRANLQELLVTVGLCRRGQNPNELFLPTNGRFGFASLIRCSTSMRPPGKEVYVHSGHGILEHTVSIKRDLPFVSQCVQRNLLPLPASVRLVIMLSSSENYISACQERFRGIWTFPEDQHRFVYTVGGVPFVHVPHPSGQAGGFRAVFNGKRPPLAKGESGIPECRRQALEAVACTGLGVTV